MIQRSILLKDGRKKNQQEGYRNFNLEAEERFIKKLVDAGGELLDFKEENFSFMGKENHNSAGL